MSFLAQNLLIKSSLNLIIERGRTTSSFYNRKTVTASLKLKALIASRILSISFKFTGSKLSDQSIRTMFGVSGFCLTIIRILNILFNYIRMHRKSGNFLFFLQYFYFIFFNLKNSNLGLIYNIMINKVVEF